MMNDGACFCFFTLFCCFVYTTSATKQMSKAELTTFRSEAQRGNIIFRRAFNVSFDTGACFNSIFFVFSCHWTVLSFWLWSRILSETNSNLGKWSTSVSMAGQRQWNFFAAIKYKPKSFCQIKHWALKSETLL